MLRILVQVNFWSAKTCFSPRALALGSLASSSPRKDPQKSLLLGYSLGWSVFPQHDLPQPVIEKGKGRKEVDLSLTPRIFCFLHIRHQECHSSPSWDVDAGVGCWDAGAGFFAPTWWNSPKTEVDQKRGPWEILKSCQSSRLRAIFGSPPTNFGIGNILLGLFSKGLLFLEKNTKVDKRGVISTFKYWCRECLRATLYSENQHHGWWLLLSKA